MPDISMCKRHDCPKAKQCYRFTAKPSEWQSYISPQVIGDQCEYFWPNAGYRYKEMSDA